MWKLLEIASGGYDPLGMDNLTYDYVEVPYTGWYRISVAVAFTTFSPLDSSTDNWDGYRGVVISKGTGPADEYDTYSNYGDALIAQQYIPARPSYPKPTYVNVSAVILLTATTRVIAYAWQNTGMPITTYTPSWDERVNRMTVEWLGA